MSDAGNLLQNEFQFGSTAVRIIQGHILKPEVDVDFVVSTDDNYLTMGSGVAGLLRREAGPEYVREAQEQCPVKAGTVVDTSPYDLDQHLPTVKRVLHGTVIDYDTADLPLEQLVYRTTANCLARAEELVGKEKLGLGRILFPAFAMGSGKLSVETCARQMCSAIKTYLAQQRPLKEIYIILHLPPKKTAQPARLAEKEARNQRFVREANLVLGVPYNPALDVRQTRDVYERAIEMQRLEDVITGKVDGKKHAVILGGPQIGKWALLDQFFERAHKPGSAVGHGRRLVKVTFGRVHANTPASFIYRRFLCALGKSEDDADAREEIRRAYADADMDCDRFLQFLEAHSDRYPEVVFLINHLPLLLSMEADDPQDFRDVRTFWGDLDRLQERVRFVCTARMDDQYQALLQRLERLAVHFRDSIEVIELRCVSEQERRDWINDLFQRYLGRTANELEHHFFEEEAGRHPYLISLAGHALIRALKADALANPLRHYDDPRTLAPFLQAARNAMEEPRQAFFDLLMRTSLDAGDRFELRTLTEAVDVEGKRRSLISDIESGDPDAAARWEDLQAKGDLRQALHVDRLRQLEDRGYLVGATDPHIAQFMSNSFATWMMGYFGVGRTRRHDQPTEVVISLLGPEEGLSSEGGMIKTLFRGRGARTITANTPLRHKDLFMRNFDTYIRNALHPTWYPDRGEFPSLEEAGGFILDHFTTGRIRGYLRELPEGSTILLEVDDVLKDIPWELMLEAVYAGEIPARVGRSIVSQRQVSRVDAPVRRDGKIRALLIGDPTDDLDEARTEVQALAQLLRDDGRFEVEPRDVLIGSEDCRVMRLLNQLGSGAYGLIHYSGHSLFEDEQSAWLLKDGKINTFDLTSSLRDAPPVLVFSSSCESAEAGRPRPVRYEDQTFDLPSAFLQAGVEAYVGTLWEVDCLVARQFAEAFYSAFLIEGHALGECLRLARMACKGERNRINWLAFVLYGDPRTTPGELFPPLGQREDETAGPVHVCGGHRL